MKSKDTKKNPKNKNEPKEIKIEETEEKKIPEKEKEKNLERFIHITTYSDIETLKRLKQLFEEVNQSAFSLRSPKEIYTRELSEEERNNNEIDYISGFQLLDKKLRITMIEGITGKAINKVKEYLPRNQMNNNTFKIFSDSKVLFNKRIFSKFELKLKFIKLRNTLENILTTYDIYTKADRYREIYNAFLNFGSILKSRTMKEIAQANLFSTDDDLLILERKYADILNEEDLTGIKKTKKKRRKISVEEFDKTLLSKTIINNNTSEVNKEKINNEEEKEKVSLKSKLDSHNILYDLSIIKKKIEDGIIPKMEKFCSKDKENISKEPIYFDSSLKNNYYVKLVNSMSQKYIHNKKNSYAYSSQLSSFFPLVEPYRNEQYIEHIENKKKWSCDKDFNRFSQPTREKFYFPKIKNFL